MVPERFKYPYDTTGESPDNLVSKETRTLTKTIRTLVPKEGPFFAKSMVVKYKGKALVRDKDYRLTFLCKKATVATGHEIVSAVKFLNKSHLGDVELQYRVIGGLWGSYSETIHELVDIVSNDDRSTDWESVLNRPSVFTPMVHLHHVDDIIGLGPTNIKLDAIRNAIENLRTHRNNALYRMIGNVQSRVNTFIDEFNDRNTALEDEVKAIRRLVGTEPLVTQREYDENRQVVSNRIQAVDAKVLETNKRLVAKDIAHDQAIAAVNQKITNLNNEHKALKQRFEEHDIFLDFQGADPNDAFITLNKVGDDTEIVYKLPQKLTNAETNIATIFNRLTAHDVEIAKIPGLETVTKNNANNLQALTGTVNQTQANNVTRFEALEKAVNDLEQDSGTALDGIKTRLGVLEERDRTEEERINTIAQTKVYTASAGLSSKITQNQQDITNAVNNFNKFKSDQTRKNSDLNNEINAAKSMIDTKIGENTQNVITPMIQGSEQKLNEVINQAKSDMQEKIDDERDLRQENDIRLYHMIRNSQRGLMPFTNGHQNYFSETSLSGGGEISESGFDGCELTTLQMGTGISYQAATYTGGTMDLPSVDGAVFDRNKFTEISVEVKLDSQLTSVELGYECLDYQGNVMNDRGVVFMSLTTAKTLSDSKLDGWIYLRGEIPSGWRTDDNPKAVATGTVTIRPVVRFTNTDTADHTVNLTNLYVRSKEPPLSAKDISGLDKHLDSWFVVKLAENQKLPAASRWDLNRFHIQPGAESFSGVEINENDEVSVRGIVYYDHAGTGDRAIFAPTAEYVITQDGTWRVPQDYDGRLAQVTIRATSFVDLSKTIHSAVRQQFIKLKGGTEIQIRVGNVTSFGTYMTVTNTMDYPDALYPRIQIAAGQPGQVGSVLIKV